MKELSTEIIKTIKLLVIEIYKHVFKRKETIERP